MVSQYLNGLQGWPILGPLGLFVCGVGFKLMFYTSLHSAVCSLNASLSTDICHIVCL